MSIYDDLRNALDRMSRSGNPQQRGIGTVGRNALPFITPFLGAAGAVSRLDRNSPTIRSKNLTGGRGAFGNIADIFKNTQQGVANAKAAFNDPLAMLFEDLISRLQQPVGVNQDDLMAQIRGQFDPIYNQRAQSAESRVGRGRDEIEGMYGALAKDYERLAPEAKAQAEQYQADIESLYGELRSNIQGHYSRVSDEQGDMMKQLGIEAAAPEVLTPQGEQATAAMDSASQLGAINEQRALDIGNIDQSYYRQGAPLAKLTGSNRSSDLQFELNDYLNQLDAEKTSGIQQAFTQLLSQAQSQAAQMQQSNTSMLWDILSSQMQGQEQQPMNADTFISGLPPQVGSEVAQAFTSLQRSPEAVYGKVEDPRHPVPGTFVSTTPQWYMAQVDKMVQQGQLSPATAQALMMYLQLKFQG